ncbi:hypothetical protein RGUI_0194 [Rhodovulum sp. P5]|uniref:hypothetical protein n=1 Tax=Rhodovulum sp. P5 TaxID=1564506 RepID=UPI0009C23AEB|nr:hypothetical protein [Rhodovulum sp. P5]ARE38335.1 hypothetical protein RGUI_0194 [Rhodovulum sp. P5]
MLGYALTLGTEEAWWQFCVLIFARLTVRERGFLAYMALMSLNESQAYETADKAVFGPGRRAAS